MWYAERDSTHSCSILGTTIDSITSFGQDGRGEIYIVDRGGEGNNLEEHAFDDPYEIHLPPGA